MRPLLDRGWQRCASLSGLSQDAALYALAAVFAGGMALKAVSSDYRAWGETAGIAYAGAAVICTVAALRHHLRPLAPVVVGWLRRFVVIGLLAGAVLAPLGAQLAWRAEAKPGAHAQPEVAVIERAGDRAAHGRDPYLVHPNSVGVSPSSDQSNVDANTFFPYLPGMAVFGILNAVHVPAALQDARVLLVAFTLVVGLAALLASDTRLSRRGRILQFLVVLPSGALPMVTGGDDLPVLALMLLGLVLAQRRNPIGAGLALGWAASMKFTAWPLLFLLAFAVRDREGRPAWGRYGIAVGAIAAPAIAIVAALSPSAFIENVVRFPLGLANIKSPAASPLLGEAFVSLLPAHKTVITAALLVLGAAIAVAALVRYPPRTPAAAAGAAAFVMTLATVLAPATRFGYLIYPANLVIWAYVMPGVAAPEQSGRERIAGLVRHLRAGPWWLRRAVEGLEPDQLVQPAGAGAQSPSSRSMTRTSTALPAPFGAPALDELTGSTKTPTSQ